TGNALANILTGTDGNNTLNGMAGADTMIGGIGDDLYVVDNVGDLVVENDNEGIDTVQTALNGYTLAAHVENLQLTGSSNIDGNGNDLDNTLTGNSGRNTLTGGLGNDYYIIQNSTDVVVENADEGIDTIQSTITYTLSDHVENLVLAGATAINGTGNALDNTLTGNSARNTLSGGLGNDVYIVQTATDVVIENVDEGIDTVLAELDWTLHSNVENLILTGAAVSGTGNTLDNILIGNEHNNTLNGMAGADTMFGGLGDDVYIIDNADDLVYENESSGIDIVQASVSYALSDHVENITLTGTANIDATGNELDNTLTGNSGLNTLYGGLGNDVYVVNNTDDVVVEYEDEGIDAVLSSVTYTLSDHVENITLTGTSGIHATGNELNNIIIGNSGANTLIGGAGEDTFDGGAGVDRIYGGEGNDTLYGGSSTDTLVGGAGDDVYILDGVDVIIENADEGTDTVYSSVTYTLAANLEILVLTGETAINGTGNALDNIFIGNSAINTLSGGAGNDVYYVSTGDVVSESSGNGIDTVYADVSWTLHNNVENLFLMGAAVSGTGNAVDNILTGNDLDNTLNGLAGADTLIGGLGDDVYIVDNIGDVVVESEDEGIDTIQSSVSYTLGDHIENLNLTGSSAINATGNALDNIIAGNTGANILIGGDGNDILDGGSGNDTLDGGAGNDFLNGGAGSDTMIGGTGDDIYVANAAGDIVIENADEGIDTVYSSVTYTLGDHLEHLTLTGTSNIHGTGNAYDNTLIGNTGANTLSGGDGNDYIYGDAGNDVIFGGFGDDIIFGGAGTDNLYGGAGADIFGFEAATAYSGVDVIKDFSISDGDRIDISDVLDGLYSGNMDNLLSFVQVSQSGSNTHISIDRDGTGSLHGWTQIANIEGVTGLGNANDMLAAGLLVVANS
ncbi:MAG: type I secretion C-terminal target domain-containing protein, partial [Candidatus Promineofilum sp.]|nr:type I secretion C-terminal target domain-containing protein [Promineifilum sp.]